MTTCLLALLIAGCQTEQPRTSPTPPAASQAVIKVPSATPAVPTATPSPPPLGTGEITARYEDGLPRVIGNQPVLRGQAAIDFAASRTDDSPFLVTGWVAYEGGVRYCAAYLSPYSWRGDCVAAGFTDLAGSIDPKLSDALTFHYAVAGLHTGPVVAVVRVHDPRAADCAPEARPICDAMMVVQRVTWTGDAATAAGPLTATGVRAALTGLGLPGDMGASCSVAPWAGCGVDTLMDADGYPFTVPDDVAPAVIAVDIEPTLAAMQRALHQAAGVDAALKKGAVFMHAGGKNGFGQPWIWRDYRWLVVGNVALLIRTHSPATAKDREFMESLVAALGAAP